MAGETYVTVSGNLTAAPKSGESRAGTKWARLRVASTSRVFDRTEGQWRDGDSLFLDVVCWRRLAENVVLTLERGDRVLVNGRLRQRSYEDQQGVRHQAWELDAESVGPDLNKVPAKLSRRLVVVDEPPAPGVVPAEISEPPSDIEALEPEPALA